MYVYAEYGDGGDLYILGGMFHLLRDIEVASERPWGGGFKGAVKNKYVAQAKRLPALSPLYGNCAVHLQ
jgi:hypothetical protein